MSCRVTELEYWNLGVPLTAALSRSDMVYGMCPKFLRYNIWDHEQTDINDIILSPYFLPDWTEHAKPLPSVPTYELCGRVSWPAC